ncbi:sigma-70 family RNA polymerase sigma factor [Lentzea sp. NPDC055074]
MSTGWEPLEALAEHGWSPERESALFAGNVTSSLIEVNLDLFVSIVARQQRNVAERLLALALGVLDIESDESIRLRNQLGVLAANGGEHEAARAILDDAHIDAGRTGSQWIDVIRVNLASVAFASGDVTAARRWLSLIERSGDSDATISMITATLHTADAQLRASREQMLISVTHLCEAEIAYRATTGSGAPTALVASAATVAARFTNAMRQGATDRAEVLVERLELFRQRIAAALGADHPDTLAVRLNLATADFTLARSSRLPSETSRALAPLSATARQITEVMGPSHPLALVAAGTLASALFEHARLAKSVKAALPALAAMREAAENASLHLGENHPHAMAAYANFATASFELARAGEAEVDALGVLETACERAKVVLGSTHATTRVLQHELNLCRQWREQEEDRGDGVLRTMRRVATNALFDDEYVSFDHASALLDQANPPDIDPAVASVWHRYATTRSKHSQSELVSHYTPLVVAEIKLLRHGVLAHANPLDVAKSGVLGLVEAVETFNAAHGGLQFEVYARQHIRNAIMEARGVFGLVSLWARTVETVMEDLDSPASGTPLRADLSELRASLLNHLAASEDLAGDPEQIAEERSRRQQLARSITRLSERDLVVLSLRYVEDMSLAEIGNVLDIPTRSVARRLDRVLRNLRSTLEGD